MSAMSLVGLDPVVVHHIQHGRFVQGHVLRSDEHGVWWKWAQEGTGISRIAYETGNFEWQDSWFLLGWYESQQSTATTQ